MSNSPKPATPKREAFATRKTKKKAKKKAGRPKADGKGTRWLTSDEEGILVEIIASWIAVNRYKFLIKKDLADEAKMKKLGVGRAITNARSVESLMRKARELMRAEANPEMADAKADAIALYDHVIRSTDNDFARLRANHQKALLLGLGRDGNDDDPGSVAAEIRDFVAMGESASSGGGGDDACD